MESRKNAGLKKRKLPNDGTVQEQEPSIEEMRQALKEMKSELQNLRDDNNQLRDELLGKDRQLAETRALLVDMEHKLSNTQTLLVDREEQFASQKLADKIMAPLKWPEPMLDYFVDECFKMVQDGRSPANETTFFRTLDRSMARKSFDITFCTEDLIQQFRRVRSLWDKYHEILKNLEIIKVQEQQSQTDPGKLHRKTGDIYASKFILIRKYEIKLNTIFESYSESKAKSLSTYRFNIEHSDRYSGDNSISSKRRSLGEPFSRQLRLKSSDMPESSQNGSDSEMQDYDKTLSELIKFNEVDGLTYAIATHCLQDPKILHSFSHVPTIERKIDVLHGYWRVMHEPKSVLENLQPADPLFAGRSPNS